MILSVGDNIYPSGLTSWADTGLESSFDNVYRKPYYSSDKGDEDSDTNTRTRKHADIIPWYLTHGNQ